MKISILCSSREHPIYPLLQDWQTSHEQYHSIQLVNSKKELDGGEILFLISCNELIPQSVRTNYKASLVIHASDLPHGRGWSPHIWQILEGKHQLTVTLLEAEDAVDSGAIWAQETVLLEGHELFDEINAKIFQTELRLMDFALENINTVVATQQHIIQPTYYRKRTPDDSQIDPNGTIAEQFDLLRVADPVRYPAFFYFRGHKYLLSLTKSDCEK